ncbi:MAG: DUF2769 domain-containing protein [Methanomicrobiales archaeon]|nr:DUF2769 domain-containing protein [Methanomicrobiales archaeon]MDD1654341.1 DUF2769 domain-containing protein [Methanomicrobiales archaeon]
MSKFEDTVKAINRMSPEEQKRAIEAEAAKCICPTCPTYNNCAKNAKETLFCWNGKSFMCISFEKKCLCPTCPVTGDLGLKKQSFCTRGSEKAQRYEHTLWGTKVIE